MSKERFPALSEDEMTAGQKQMADAVMATRGSLRGFEAMMRSPDLGDRLQRVGEYIRYRSSIPRHLNEIAILLMARSWDSQFEWFEHNRIATEAGLKPAIIAAIAEGRRPNDLDDDEALVYDFCAELIASKEVSDQTFKRTAARFGEIGIIDLIGALGYYTTLAMLLNVGRYQLPEGMAPPLKKLS